MSDPLLVDVPERLFTARLLLRPPRAGDGAMMCEAVRASLHELRPWMPWAQHETTPEASESHARRMQARFALREDLAFLTLERAVDGSLRDTCVYARVRGDDAAPAPASVAHGGAGR